jgi:hypothetical protein
MLRDFHQLRDAPKFGVTAIEGFLTVEAALHEALRFVPYCDEHRRVWSAQFTSIILDGCAQVDSLWTSTMRNSSSSKSKFILKDHYNQFGSRVASQGLVFIGGPSPCIISPFADWTGTNFRSPAWWLANNKLKHDRFANQAEGTLENAVNSVGSLLLAIVYSGQCDVALISGQLLLPSSHNPWANTDTGLLRDVSPTCMALIETKLFAHPLGVFSSESCEQSNWWESPSPRFNMWWALNAEQFTKSKTI